MSTDAGTLSGEQTPTPTPTPTPPNSSTDGQGGDGKALPPPNQFASIVPPTPEATPPAEGEQQDPPAQGAEGDQKPGEAADAAEQQYEAFTLPEGWEIADADLQAFTQIASSLEVRQDGKGLTQKGAQQLVDLFIGIEQNRGEFLGKLQEQQDADRDRTWQEELQKDPEIGGDKFPAAQANIKALEDSGVLDPAFSQLLLESGYFKAPAVIKQLAKLGSMLQESPTLLGDGGGGGDGKTPAQRMFVKSGHV